MPSSTVTNLAQLAFIRAHTFLYRCSRGAIGGRLFGNSVLLLTTIGRKTAKPRTRPLIYHQAGSDWIVVASNAGAQKHPDWWLNLQSHPEATIQVMAEKMQVVGQKATPLEKETLWPQFIRMHPNYTEYQKKTPREIPVVILRRVIID